MEIAEAPGEDVFRISTANLRVILDFVAPLHDFNSNRAETPWSRQSDKASFAGGFFPFLPAVNYHSAMSSGEDHWAPAKGLQTLEGRMARVATGSPFVLVCWTTRKKTTTCSYAEIIRTNRHDTF